MELIEPISERYALDLKPKTLELKRNVIQLDKYPSLLCHRDLC
jgi:hypothetical protein